MKKYSWILVALVVLLAGVVGYNQFFAPEAVGEKPFVWIHQHVGNEFYALHSVGFFDACEDLGVECKEYATDEGTAMAKIAQCELMLADGGTSGAIFIVHDDSFDACLDQLDAPWVNSHGLYDDDPNFVARITPDAVADAVMAAHAMAEAVGGQGKVILSQCQFSPLENSAVEAFRKTLEDEYGMETVESVELGLDRTAGVAIAAALLTRHPDAVGAYGATSVAPPFWAGAAQEHGLEPGELVIIGNDAIQENLDLVKAGWVYALVAQPAYEENYEAVVTLVALRNGEEIEANQILPASLATAENADEYYALADRVKEYLESR